MNEEYINELKGAIVLYQNLIESYKELTSQLQKEQEELKGKVELLKQTNESLQKRILAQFFSEQLTKELEEHCSLFEVKE